MTYSPKSLYSETPIKGRFLDHYVHRKLEPHRDDAQIQVQGEWVFRPDLMALDIYGDEDLWWVIPVRNGLEDLVFDVIYGRTLVVPPLELIRKSIG